MATMVVRGSSPLATSTSIQEKGSRNKRKFRADPPIFDPNFISNQMSSDCSSYDFSLMEQSQEMLSLGAHRHANDMCDMCTITPYYRPKEEEQEQFREAEWNEIAESELEDTLLKNLNMIFKTAIKMIISYGYSEEVAINAILRTGLCFGTKDTVTSIVDNCLIFLKMGHEFDSLVKEKLLEELTERETSALNEMVSVVRDFRPSFSRGEAMWRLLISDMSVYHAAAMENAFASAPQVEQDPKNSNYSNQSSSESNSSSSHKPNLVLPNPKNAKELDMPNVLGIPSLPNGRFSASIKEASLDCVIEETSSLYISQSKSSGKKGHSGSTKRESILRQKTVHFEKSYRMFGSKATIRASKHNGLNGLLLDKKSKSMSDTNALNMKNTLMKLNKAVGSDVIPPQADISLNISFKDLPAKKNNIANTELSLSLPSSPSSSLPSTSNNGNWVPLDKVDEMLQKLCIREKELEAEKQEWSEWAQQKVMEAARRLGKDKPELQSLRQEKDEIARLKKEKQSLEESTRKKLAEMEIALSKASAQVEKHNAEARDMERENIELRRELVAAKFRAAESAASCHGISKRELNNNKNIRSWEREKAQLHEELVAEKKKLNQLTQQHGQAKEHYDQLEARWKKEENTKLGLLSLHNAMKKEREQIEVSGRSKENAMRIKAETDLQKHKDDIRKLEIQISQLRQKTDSSKIAALKKWGNDLKMENNASVISKLFELHDEDEVVDRERECVMCLSEEMSVVFLPCAHQVVCATCNEIHEKQGMKDCPSCRTTIEKRIIVRST